MIRSHRQDIDITHDILYSSTNYQLRTPFTITNRSNHTYVFKVKTNQKQAINMPKTHGFILPHSACSLPLKIISKPHDKFDLKLQVSYGIASEEQIASNVSQMLNFDQNNTFKHIITLRRLNLSSNNDSREQLDLSNHSKNQQKMHFNFQEYTKHRIQDEQFNSQKHAIFQQKRLNFNTSAPLLVKPRKNSFQSQKKLVVNHALTNRTQKSQQKITINAFPIKKTYRDEESFGSPHKQSEDSQNNFSIKAKFVSNSQRFQHKPQPANRSSDRIEQIQKQQPEVKIQQKRCDLDIQSQEAPPKIEQKQKEQVFEHKVENLMKKYETQNSNELISENSLAEIEKERQIIQSLFQAQQQKDKAIQLKKSQEFQSVLRQEKAIQTSAQRLLQLNTQKALQLEKEEAFKSEVEKALELQKQNDLQIQQQNVFLADLSIIVQSSSEAGKISKQQVDRKQIIINGKEQQHIDKSYDHNALNRNTIQPFENSKLDINELHQLNKYNAQQKSSKMIKTSNVRGQSFFEEEAQNMTKTEISKSRNNMLLQEKQKQETVTKSQIKQSGQFLPLQNAYNIILRAQNEAQRKNSLSILEQSNGISLHEDNDKNIEEAKNSVKLPQQNAVKNVITSSNGSSSNGVLYSFNSKNILRSIQEPNLNKQQSNNTQNDHIVKKLSGQLEESIIMSNKNQSNSIEQSVILDKINTNNLEQSVIIERTKGKKDRVLKQSVIIRKYSYSKEKDDFCEDLSASKLQQKEIQQKQKEKNTGNLNVNYIGQTEHRQYHNELQGFQSFSRNMAQNMTKSSTIPKNEDKSMAHMKISEKNPPTKRAFNRFNLEPIKIKSISSINVNSQSKTQTKEDEIIQALQYQTKLKEQLLILKTKIECQERFIAQINLAKEGQAKALPKKYHWFIFIIVIILAVLLGSFTRQLTSLPKNHHDVPSPSQANGIIKAQTNDTTKVKKNNTIKVKTNDTKINGKINNKNDSTKDHNLSSSLTL